MKYNGKVIDMHLHLLGGFDNLDSLLEGSEELRKTLKYNKMCIQSIPQWDKKNLGQNIICLLMKLMNPKTTYVFGGLDYYLPEGIERIDFAEQAEALIAMGFNGIKMIKGEPQVNKNVGGIPLNSHNYDKLYSYLEKNNIPVLLHVAYPLRDELYTEAESVFQRYPGIKFCLTHFYFTSDSIDKAARVLDKYPNVSYDITPGMEMYANFSKRPDEWHDFFTRYSSRIMFGTDNGWGTEEQIDQKAEHAVYKNKQIQRFLETSDSFRAYNLDLKGINLDADVLYKIYFLNAYKFIGTARKVNKKAAVSYFDQMICSIKRNNIHNDQTFYQMEQAKKILEAI